MKSILKKEISNFFLQELSEIKLSHSKLKKLLSETNTELGHAVRRGEQYETEVNITTYM